MTNKANDNGTDPFYSKVMADSGAVVSGGAALLVRAKGGRLREGAESYAKLAQIAGARSYLLLPSTVAPERRRLSSIRRWLRILKVSGPTRRY